MNRAQRRHPAAAPQFVPRPIPPRTLERLRTLQAQIQHEVDACVAALDLPPNAQFRMDDGMIVLPPAVETPDERAEETAI